MTVFPVIHSNGTSGITLSREYTEAILAVRKAASALAAVTVHGRDYYVIRHGDAASVAFAEHMERRRKLEQVERELCLILDDLARQMEERTKL